MKVGIQDIKKCVDKAREIAEQYKLYVQNVGTIKSVDQLLWICGTYLGKKIEVFELDNPVPHGTILGTYIKEPDRFVINIQPKLEPEWQRFVLCKEIFHVLLDEPDCRIKSIVEHLDEVEAVFPVLDSQPGPAVISEVLAEIAAMEFLFPFGERVLRAEAFGKAAAANAANGKPHAPDYLAVAKEFAIPQVLVEKYTNPSYMQNLSAFPA